MQDIVYLEDLPAYKEAPRFARKFADALLSFDQEEITIEIENHKFHGKKGLSSNIQYARYDNQLLGEELSYTFLLRNQKIEISLQFYENSSNHYRLFTFTRCNDEVGQVFSVNLSTNRLKDGRYALKNKIKFSDRIESDPDIAKKIRSLKQQVLCDLLADYEFDISDKHDVFLGEFDALNLKGEFINTNVNQFVYDMFIITLLKGHYMGNKGYHLDFLPVLNK